MKLKLQKYDYETPSKTPKTGLKGAIRSVIIGFIVAFFGACAVEPSRGDEGIFLPMSIIIFGILFAFYGIGKFFKIMWDNIPE
ncbi:MAG: hypothetical protein DBX55_04200 [Verrucomicrobia bacterium]|nr:MAG: hypothetical protein DBX55_04200 [Verrucomicrobiota bacterium]